MGSGSCISLVDSLLTISFVWVQVQKGSDPARHMELIRRRAPPSTPPKTPLVSIPRSVDVQCAGTSLFLNAPPLPKSLLLLIASQSCPEVEGRWNITAGACRFRGFFCCFIWDGCTARIITPGTVCVCACRLYVMRINVDFITFPSLALPLNTSDSLFGRMSNTGCPERADVVFTCI